MPIKFIFIRHAEAEHNIAYHKANQDPMIFYSKDLQDSKLTHIGKNQAINIAMKLAEKYQNIEAIWASSLQRCIQTANEIYEEINVNEYYIHDNLMERQTPGFFFNYRTEKTKLKELYGNINMEYIPEIPAIWSIRESDHILRSRMYMIIMLILNLYKGTDSVIIIVGHYDAITSLTGKNLKNAEYFEMTEEEIREL